MESYDSVIVQTDFSGYHSNLHRRISHARADCKLHAVAPSLFLKFNCQMKSFRRFLNVKNRLIPEIEFRSRHCYFNYPKNLLFV